MKKHPGCLGYVGDDILPSYIGIIINHYNHPHYQTRIQWKAMEFFFYGSGGGNFRNRISSRGQVNFDWAPQSAKDARQEAVSAASETGLTGRGTSPSSVGWQCLGKLRLAIPSRGEWWIFYVGKRAIEEQQQRRRRRRRR